VRLSLFQGGEFRRRLISLKKKVLVKRFPKETQYPRGVKKRPRTYKKLRTRTERDPSRTDGKESKKTRHRKQHFTTVKVIGD